jgi:hypothetical protein
VFIPALHAVNGRGWGYSRVQNEKHAFHVNVMYGICIIQTSRGKKCTLYHNLLVIYPEENKYPPYKPKYTHWTLYAYFFIFFSPPHELPDPDTPFCLPNHHPPQCWTLPLFTCKLSYITRSVVLPTVRGVNVLVHYCALARWQIKLFSTALCIRTLYLTDFFINLCEVLI